jgi:hypothetical protein
VSVPEPVGLKPHDLAKAEIDAWRGRCINIFSRGEKAVTDCLTAASEGKPPVRLEPLAGQRLNSLERLVGEHEATKAQKDALISAIATWRLHDEKRPTFSHGVATELLDRHGVWHVQFDFVAVTKAAGLAYRVTYSKSEAEIFEKSLHDAFTKLAGQLGQLRKRLAS